MVHITSLTFFVVTPIYVIGSLIARNSGCPFKTSTFIWGLAALIPAVLAALFANEYMDIETDALT